MAGSSPSPRHSASVAAWRSSYQRHSGYWWRPCILSDPVPPKSLDVPGQEAFYRHIAIKYMEAHESRLPVVVVARVARTWALFHPIQQIRLDQIETRELYFSGLGLGMYYVLAVGTLAGPGTR